MNTIIETIGDYEIRKYGSCGVFFFMVAEVKTKKRIAMSIKTLDMARDKIYEIISNSKEKAIFQTILED
jgi:hypothetical protein